ncbi:MAG TPA: endonuclease/exonuclease/phosphatase family protein [Actinomycetota bacterium]|nr:endonuclease/exonuclease/phosphatase family protein [Actinomycetota bacterium]
MRLRVVVYNVRGFRDGLERVVTVIGHFDPDVVLLNETGGRLALRRCARALGMQAARDPWSPFRRRVKNAVLVRSPWRIVECRLHRFADVRKALYPRGALVVSVGRAGRRLWVYAIHLGLHPLERLHAAEELADLTRGRDGPVMIGGDCNETPDGRAMIFLGERFWDAWLLGGDVDGETFPAPDPTARIDFLFVSEEVKVERVLVPSVMPEARIASDHLPVVAELRLTDPAETRAG